MINPNKPASQRFAGLAPFFQPLQRILAVLIAFLVMELCVGHPALRTSWVSRGSIEHMVSCRVLTITAERQVIIGQYESLLCFVEPAKERTLRYWLLRPITRWFS